MITAVQEEEHAGHRRRTRSAASGPVFSPPALAGVFDLQPVSMPATANFVAPSIPQAAPSPTPSLDLTGFLGRSVGSGQCVALVRAARPALGPTSTWEAGGPVRGNTALQPGTPIATFDRSNRYANTTDGSSHAAIYLGQNAHGLLVLDQWAGSSAAVRTIPWTTPGGAPVNTGAAFRVVQSG